MREQRSKARGAVAAQRAWQGESVRRAYTALVFATVGSVLWGQKRTASVAATLLLTMLATVLFAYVNWRKTKVALRRGRTAAKDSAADEVSA